MPCVYSARYGDLHYLDWKITIQHHTGDMHMTKIQSLAYSLVISFSLIISGCNTQQVPGDYDASEVGKIKKVVPGVIVSMRPVRLHNKNAELGVSTPLNATGTNNDAALGRSHGFEYVIKLNSGGIISVVQAENVKLKTKQHILVIYGRNTRVVADNGSENY